MMKKTITVMAAGIIFSAFLYGCAPAVVPTNTSPTPTPEERTAPIETPEPRSTLRPDRIIAYTQPVDVTGYTVVGECEEEFGDGANRIILYTSAARGEDGEIMWDDGQDWVLRLNTASGPYDLFNGRITGRAYFSVADHYNDGEAEKVISLFISDAAGSEIREYRYDGTNYTENTVYSTDATAKEGTGLIYSSVPDYE